VAFTPPVAADLIARFPIFAAVPEATIAGALAEAGIRIDDTWTAGDYALGIMLYAAHLLTLDGQGTGAEAALGAAGALGFTSFKSGELHLDRPPAAASGQGGEIAATTYVRCFWTACCIR
jgi:Protein of unknown function (DUF4054)